MTSLENPVLLGSYRSPLEAHLMQATLGSHNIESTLADEHLIAMNVWFSNVIGGVKLYVDANDYDAAQAIIVAMEENVENDPTSTEVSHSPLSQLKCLLLGILGILIGDLPLSRLQSNRRNKSQDAIKKD